MLWPHRDVSRPTFHFDEILVKSGFAPAQMSVSQLQMERALIFHLSSRVSRYDTAIAMAAAAKTAVPTLSD